jgi:hypothetical protein
MNFKTAALITVSASLLSTAAFAQQNNNGSRDRTGNVRSVSSSRASGPSERSSSPSPRDAGASRFQARPAAPSDANPRPAATESQNRNPVESWNRPAPASARNTPAFGRQSEPAPSREASGFGRQIEPTPVRSTSGFGRQDDPTPNTTAPATNWRRPQPNGGRPNQAPDAGRTVISDSRRGQDGGASREHAQDPRPSVGSNWNFGRDKDLMARNYDNDSRSHNLQVVNNFNVYQRPEWGNHWREGYFGWGGDAGIGFHAGSFSFGFYLNTPFAAPCYVSPWYYYSSLPAYIPADRCYVAPSYNMDWNIGSVYTESMGDAPLDQAINEVTDAFNHQDVSAIDALMPDNGRIAVSTDGHYDYSLSAGDFHDMMADNITNTRTVSFEIESVRRTATGAFIDARHAVSNPDGSEDVVNLQFRVHPQDGRFVISDFMTSH